MLSRILYRVGAGLLAVGAIAIGATVYLRPFAWMYIAALNVVVVAAGGFLLSGRPRAALLVRTLAVFLLAAGVFVCFAAPVFQPLDLTLTEIRLDPSLFVGKALLAGFVLCVLFWVTVELGRPTVRDAILGSGIRRWDMRLPAQMACGLVALGSLLLWLALHGQSADLATSLAIQQLGPDYRYHLSWISSSRNDHGTSVTGVVTAWNQKEIREVLLHWETR